MPRVVEVPGLHSPIGMSAGLAGMYFQPGYALGVGATGYGMRKLALALYNPDGASALRQMLASGVNSAKGKAAQATLSKILESIGDGNSQFQSSQ